MLGDRTGTAEVVARRIRIAVVEEAGCDCILGPDSKT